MGHSAPRMSPESGCARLSSLTSLRRAPHRPDPACPGCWALEGRRCSRPGTAGARRSEIKGEPWAQPRAEDIRGGGHPPSPAGAMPERARTYLCKGPKSDHHFDTEERKSDSNLRGESVDEAREYARRPQPCVPRRVIRSPAPAHGFATASRSIGRPSKTAPGRSQSAISMRTTRVRMRRTRFAPDRAPGPLQQAWRGTALAQCAAPRAVRSSCTRDGRQQETMR